LDFWRYTHVTIFFFWGGGVAGRGRTSLLLPAGAENPSYAIDSHRKVGGLTIRTVYIINRSWCRWLFRTHCIKLRMMTMSPTIGLYNLYREK